MDFTNDYSDTETEVARLGANIGLTDQWFIEAELTSTDVEKDVQNSFRGWVVSTPSSVNSKQNEFTPRLIGVVPVNGGDMVLTAGVDLRETDYESGITNINDEQKVTSYYAQTVIPVVDKLSLTLGGRHSKVENDVVRYVAEEVNDRATVFEAGARFQYTSNLSFFARMDENFRFAKVDELTYAPPGQPLDNQKGKSKELGLEWSGKELHTKLFIYRLELEDEIAFDPTAAAPTGAPGYFGPGANVNLDSTVHDGFVLDSKYNVNSAVDLIANFTYSDATFTSGALEGNSISGVPERIFTLASNYRVSDSMKAYAEVIYTGDQYKSGDSANSQDKHGSYSVMSVSADYNWQEWTYSVRINNLLDREYSESVNSYGAINPSPERNFWLSAAVKF